MARRDFALSPAQRIDARAAVQILDGTGISLEQAARRAVHGRRALKRIQFSEAVDQFVRSRLTDGCRSTTVGWYEKMLKPADTKFGDQWFDDIDRNGLFTWLKEIEVSEHTRAGMSRALRALWRWGLAHEPQLVAVDVTPGLRTASPRNEGDAPFLKVDDVAKAMAASGQYRSALALLFFGGVRPEEVAGDGKPRMLWKQVNLEEKTVRVTDALAKSGKPRIIEGIPDTVWAWLEPGKDEQPICRAHIRQAVRLAKTTLGHWSHDLTRHTFATYALALTGDAGKVSTWIGHEGKPTLLHRDYKGLVRKVEAEKFWALRPAV